MFLLFFTGSIVYEIRFKKDIDLLLGNCSCRDFILLKSCVAFKIQDKKVMIKEQY